jgi:alpha/beta superfamily hydrolase
VKPAEIVEERVSFPSNKLTLDGVLAYPESAEPIQTVLFCSPHPHFAGNMENNVIRTLARQMAHNSVTLRFDYRGVGASQIDLAQDSSVFDYWEEVEREKLYEDALCDVGAAQGFLKSTAIELPMVIVGYSLGALLALLTALASDYARTAIAISPPWTKVEFSFLADYRIPALVLTAINDFLFSEIELTKTRELASPKVQFEVLTEGDHFFRDAEDILFNRISTFAANVISG